ncbi:MAG: glycosyltransferase [Candidatus Moranbacteria bacterium]|nr:glycosyltransferase [Candidatus Moranbacteria bacterium]
MKILFLFPHFIQPGGAANVVTKFARGLQEKNHTVKILCARASRDFLEQNKELSIIQLKIPTSNSISYWMLFPFWQNKINKELAKHEDCILFPHVLPSNWWAWLYKKNNKNQKVVWYCHEPSAFIHSKDWINAIKNPLMRMGAKLLNPILRKIDISLEKNNDIVICNSNFTANQYEKAYKKSSNFVVHPPLNIKKVKPEKEKLNYFFTISRLTKFKNIDTIINAFERISQKYPDYKLIIAGEGEEKEKLQKLVKDKKLNDKIKFLGKVSDNKLSDLYKKAIATIIASKNEPFGLVPIESMMHGTPVIAHNSGGPKETVTKEKTGYLYNNQDGLEKYIKKIIKMDKNNFLNMQRLATRETKKYDELKTINKLEKIINNFSQ